MKIVITFLFIISYALGATLTLNSSKEQGKPYATIHLRDDKPILCETSEEAFGKKLYLCMFEGELKSQIAPKFTPYADIDFFVRGGKFYIYIKPKFYSAMFNADAKLYTSQTTPLKNNKNAKHWTILVYDTPPFVKKDAPTVGINFPVTYPKYQYPSVGALDLNGAPINYVQSNDINLYLDVKKSYERGAYEDVIKQANKAIENYTNTIFLSEFVLYKIRSIDKILDGSEVRKEYDRDDVILQAKAWTKSFPGDENMAEALMLVAKSYLKIGFYSDANYFLDILISEYSESNFTKWGILYYGDSLYANGKKDQAIKLYEDVLYSSKNMNTASEAAMRLAKHFLGKGKRGKATKYLDKILKANREFIFEDKKAAYELARNLAKERLFKSAATVADILLKKTKKREENYESILKDAGIWHEKAKDINDAYKQLKRYQKEFKNGDYNSLVQQALDRLFFELSETNETKLTNYYDELIDRYDNDIKYKALLAKARLLLSNREYDKVLELKDEFSKDINNTETMEVLEDAAMLAAADAMKKDDCLHATILVENYPNIESRIKEKDRLFECLVRLSRYEKAEMLAKENTKTSNLDQKLLWLSNLEHAIFKQRRWNEAIYVAKDVEALGEVLGDERANYVYYDRFFALVKLKKYEKALQIASIIEKKFPKNFRNVEVYEKIVDIAKELGNDIVVISYAKKALKLEKESDTFILSPNLEFNYIASLQKIGKVSEAKDEALKLLDKNVDNKDISRILYTIAEACIKNGEEKEAASYFKKCAELSEETSWTKICQENLNLTGINTVETNSSN